MNQMSTARATAKNSQIVGEKETRISARSVNIYYGEKHAIKDLSIEIPDRSVSAFIGPSGCGKSTFLRSINRMNDTIEGCRLTGEVRLDDKNIYDADVDVVQLRQNFAASPQLLAALKNADFVFSNRLGCRWPTFGFADTAEQA